MKPAYIKETIHNNKRRAVWHDYHSRCIYMITITALKGAPSFGSLRIAEPISESHIELTEAGKIIVEEILKTPVFHPEIKILEKVLMPDHFHILLFVTKPIRKHLGDIVQAMKAAMTARIRKTLGNPALSILEEGFHDRILTRRNQLSAIVNYIRENPRRLAVRRARPEFFRRVNGLDIGARRYAAYGNIYLLRNPFCEQVVVHRRDSEAEQAAKRERWLHAAANGGVLVSPFISPAEKAIRSEAEALDAKIILITNEAMPERYKPAAHDFALCEAGRLLIISLPMEISRAACLAMNTLAATISEGEAGEGM